MIIIQLLFFISYVNLILYLNGCGILELAKDGMVSLVEKTFPVTWFDGNPPTTVSRPGFEPL